jgi:hypothetical protein
MESSQTRSASTETQPIHPHPSRVRRRSFLKRLGMAGATLLPASALLATKAKAQVAESNGKLSKGDVAILRLLAAAEIIETDLWQQYNELGGIGATGSISQPYITDLQVLDGDMPQYIADNTDARRLQIHSDMRPLSASPARTALPAAHFERNHMPDTYETVH